MGTTPNYGWTYPPATNYVKDLPTNLGDLADEIDATVYGLGSSGLSLVTASTFTSQSSVSINNCFTSTYSSYRIMLDISNVSAWSATNLKLRASGTDTTSNYIWAERLDKSNGTGANYGSTSGTYFPIAGANTSEPTNAQIDIIAPQLARKTAINCLSVMSDTADWWAVTIGGQLHTTTQYDGFTLTQAGGNITGTVRVYGYKNS